MEEPEEERPQWLREGKGQDYQRREVVGKFSCIREKRTN